MSGLYGSLSIALSALMADQQALETSTNNVANANTPGFSRQRPVMVPADPVIVGSLSFGQGVVLQKVESLRDPILELRLNQATQDQGKLNASITSLQQIQTMFSGTDSGIGNAITKFFDSVQQLSTNPSDLALRQGVLTAAGNMATAFNTTSSNLQTQRANLDLDVKQTVNDINTLTSQVAGLNQQITNLENVHQDASSFVDRRTTLIRQLSGLVDVSVIQTEHGISLTTANGVALVSEGLPFKLSTAMNTDGMQHIIALGRDVTSSIVSGKLGGLITQRDNTIPTLQTGLDQLSAGLSTVLNTAHRAGFDLSGTAGVNLFSVPPAGGIGAAVSMQVAITDPALFAASSDGSSGSNGNAVLVTAVHDQAVAGGQRPLDFYANIVFTVGSKTANAGADLDAANTILQQLQDQRAAISGVSLDEEATNMIQYQTAYQASARVISTINSMLDAAVNLGRY